MRSSSMPELIRSKPLLGTFVSVRAGGAARAELARAIDAAFAEIARIQACMSFHDPASELSTLNREGHVGPVQVSSDLFTVLSLARTLFQATDGTFDVSVAPHLVQWGYLPRCQTVSRGASFAAVELRSDQSVRFTAPLLVD